MSYARGNGQNGGHFYSNITQPVKLDMQFTVDATNVNGLGLKSLKSNGYVRNVFMNSSAAFTGTTHTSTSVTGIASTANLKVGMPVQGGGIAAGTTIASIVSATAITLSAATSTSATGSITYQGFNDNYASPNPAAGYAWVQLKSNYRYFLGSLSSFVSPVSGTPINVTTGVTAGLAYVITSVGTTSVAQWQKLGLPAGLTPAVGQSFIAPLTTTATGSGVIEVPSVSGISSIEVVGDPTASINNSNIATNGGAWILLQLLGPTLAGSALGTHTHNFTVIGGQAASTTNDIANYAGPLLGKQEATDATYVGANSATRGGVVAASAGTPAGTVTFGPVAPADGSVISLSMYFDVSSVTIDGL